MMSEPGELLYHLVGQEYLNRGMRPSIWHAGWETLGSSKQVWAQAEAQIIAYLRRCGIGDKEREALLSSILQLQNSIAGLHSYQDTLAHELKFVRDQRDELLTENEKLTAQLHQGRNCVPTNVRGETHTIHFHLTSADILRLGQDYDLPLHVECEDREQRFMVTEMLEQHERDI